MNQQDSYYYIGDECYIIKYEGGQSQVRRVFPDRYDVVFKGSYDACTNYIHDMYDDEYTYSY